MLVENGQVNVYRVVIVSHKVLPRLPTGAGGRSSGAGLWAGCRLYPLSLRTLCDKQLPPVHSEAINPPENAQPNDAGPSGGAFITKMLSLLKHIWNSSFGTSFQNSIVVFLGYGFSFWKG